MSQFLFNLMEIHMQVDIMILVFTNTKRFHHRLLVKTLFWLKIQVLNFKQNPTVKSWREFNYGKKY